MMMIKRVFFFVLFYLLVAIYFKKKKKYSDKQHLYFVSKLTLYKFKQQKLNAMNE
jgi:hypothetical protein